MSLHLEFEPHSWYKSFAIKHNRHSGGRWHDAPGVAWEAYTDNGMTGYIDTLEAETLRELKQAITAYHQRQAAKDAYNRKLIGEN